MAFRPTEEFRAEAVRVALTSGLPFSSPLSNCSIGGDIIRLGQAAAQLTQNRLGSRPLGKKGGAGMSRSEFISAKEGVLIQDALHNGEADRAFALLALYLRRNDMRLSDDVMRLYIENELFDCMGGLSAKFRRHMEA